ncbi:branched-chain amino acid transport system II carrier protein [uncultured Aquimarina sp.]|uniref:branched-chain amino acid transport system II carrier protein n=1 Tax=uncultured Aquimarina sp. TaxID=575652 RepID=UPI0026125EB8|nr:branched-chain amino acid transport system II carrier protein [uncultured Aquimarina sp.]
MRFNKETFITGFALFSMFFGAGNLILPPNLGFKAGDMWFLVVIGFVISAVVLPLLGIFAHAKLQGTMLDFGKKVSPTFSLIYCFIVYAISIALPSPRTASVTHEMAIQPFFGTSSLLTSSIYFGLVLFFVLNRSKILNILGKFLTPIIFIVILSIIFIGIFSTHPPMNSSIFQTPVIDGLLEGYQTFDAIGAVVVGGVIIISLRIKGRKSFQENRTLIRNSGIIAGIGLFIVYAGLIYNGALFNGAFEKEISRTELLSGLSLKTLGNIGSTFLSVLVSLACFTTAVGIVTGTSDFIKGIFRESQQAYIITAIIGCILGVVMGQLDVHDIIVVAVPALMFIYPITIVLILLNVLPDKFTSSVVFRAVVVITIVFSLPDFLASIGFKDQMQSILELIPLGEYSLAWLLPAIFGLIISNVFIRPTSLK